MKDVDHPAGIRTCSIRDLPDKVDAGRDARLLVEVTSAPPLVQTGIDLIILDAAGRTVGTATVEPAGGANVKETAPGTFTGTVELTAPDTIGTHDFAVRLPSIETEGSSYPEVNEAFQLTVVAHRLAPVVWGLPNAVEPRSAFSLKVGAKCTSDCDARGWEVFVRNSDGSKVAAGKVGARIWPGTEGLRYAELTLDAPGQTGLFGYEATVHATGAALPHEPVWRKFNIRVAPPTDASLHVHVVDTETGEPLSGIKVVAGPFATRTGADGAAILAVPKGEHQVFVSGGKYIPYRTRCTVDDVERMDVALERDSGLTLGMLWG